MPTRKEDLPSTLKRSPRKVQDTYAKTLDSAEETYDSEERAHRTAWSAVKHVAEKQGDHWELKDEKGPSDPQAARSTPAQGETASGVDANAGKKHLYDIAKRLKIEGRSRMTKDELVDAIRRANERETAAARS